MAIMIKNVLVTGASGLIGNAVASQLIDQGHSVICLDREPALEKRASKYIQGELQKLDFDSELRDLKLTTIVHCAAHPGGKSLSEPSLDVEVNAFGTMRLFEWAARNQVHVIFLSSSAIYGKQPDVPLKESDKVNPNTIYAVCKEAAENFLRILEEGYGLKWTVLRLFATYGAGHKPSKFQGIVNILMTQMMEGTQIVVKGSLQRKRGLVEVRDAARAIVMAVEKTESFGKTLNISHPRCYTIGEIAETIAQGLGKKISDFKLTEEAGTVGDTFYNYADSNQAREMLGFEGKITLQEGVAKMIQQRLAAK